MKFNHVLLLLLFTGCNPLAKHYDLIISNVNIVDVSSGKVSKHRWVYINNERITTIDDGRKFIQADTTIDGSDKYLIPGLWDMYARGHEYFANVNIAHGIVGGAGERLRLPTPGQNAIIPEIYACGPGIDGPNPDAIKDNITEIVTTRIEAIDAVSKQKAEGVDWIKVLNYLSPDVYAAIAHCADSLELTFTGHVPFKVSIWNAVRLKHRSIEHNLGILEACSSKSDSIYAYYNTTDNSFASWTTDMFDLLVKTFDEHRFDSLGRFLASHDTYITPTLVAARGWSHRFDPAFQRDDRMKYIHPEILNDWKEKRDTAEITSYRRKHEFERTLMARLQNFGLKFLAATDAASFYTYPGFALHEELQLFVQDGFTNLEALQTATLNPALFTNKLKDYGTIDENKYASLVLLNSNPLDDISNTLDINSVILKGNYLSRRSLDSLMKAQETLYYYRP